MLQVFVVCFVIVSAYLLPQADGWPAGTYGLIKSATGCPNSNVVWHEGSRYFDSEDHNNKNAVWPGDWYNSLAGYVNTHGVSLEFCIKESHASSSSAGIETATTWPKGSYCILKYGACPTGLHEGYIYWDDEDDDSHNRHSGALPDGTYDRDTKIYFCCRDDQSYDVPISLPSEKPFVLLRKGGHCQDVADMGITEVIIHWDNEDDNNKDDKGGEHPDEDGGGRDHRLYFCHYNPFDPAAIG